MFSTLLGGQNGREDGPVPCNAAHCLILALPNIVAISIMASTSSELLKKGKRLERIVSNMMPADHISISTRAK
jgi:hypothetical protein